MITPSPRLRSPRCLTLPLALATVLVGACSDDQPIDWASALGSEGGDRPVEAPPVPDDPEQAFDRAIDATRSVESTAVTFLVSVNAEAYAVEGELAASGRGHVTAEVTGEEMMELRSDGETAWLRIEDPAVVEELPEGVSWIEASRDELVGIGVLNELEETWDVLPVLRGIEVVDDLGVDEVEGVPVRKLRGDVDFEAALDAASPDERSALEESITVEGDVDEFVAEVALDADGRVRSLEVDIEAGGDDLGIAMLMSLSLEVQAFNQAVEVPERPPSGDTVRLDDVPGLDEVLAEGAG